ncbi:putative transporter MamV [Azospirillaceae bacterium]
MISPHCKKCRDQAAWTDLFTALALSIFKNLMGFITGSMALHAHALHSLADFLTKSVNLASIKLSSRPASALFPYGYGKIQFLSANFIGVSLIIGSLVFLWENISHLDSGHISAPLPIALFGALISAVIAELMHRYLTCVADHNNSPAIRAAAADNRGDALSSLAVMAGVLLSLMGWRIADHLSAILVGLLVLRVGVRVAWDSIHGLMDGAISSEVLDQIRQIANDHEHVLAVDDVRGRRMGEVWEINLRLKVPAETTTKESDFISEQLCRRVLKSLRHSTVLHIIFIPQ